MRAANFLALAVSLSLVAPAAAAADVAQEAKAFMEAYAKDLRSGDRAAVADRYDRRGAYMVGQGRKTLVPFEALKARYATGWSPPKSFEWRDLSFEAAGPDAVVVVGAFVWGGAEGETVFSYTGLLNRQDGMLRIRLEDEDPTPAP